MTTVALAFAGSEIKFTVVAMTAEGLTVLRGYLARMFWIQHNHVLSLWLFCMSTTPTSLPHLPPPHFFAKRFVSISYPLGNWPSITTHFLSNKLTSISPQHFLIPSTLNTSNHPPPPPPPPQKKKVMPAWVEIDGCCFTLSVTYDPALLWA